jgi:hypothetical protein
MEFTPANAPAVALLFVGTTLLCLLALGTAGVLAWRGRRRPARRVVEGLAVVVLLYGGALLAHSFTSHDTILEPGELKYLCELDCHLAYSVEGARAAATGSGEANTGGRFVVITVRTWFDPKSISARRGDAPLTPNPRAIRLEDDQGAAYEISRRGEKALGAGLEAASLLRKPLRPGESYRTDLVFEVPRERTGLRLLISEDVPQAAFIVGHENSLFHKKIWFRVPLDAGSLRGREAGCYTARPWRSLPPPSNPAPIDSRKTTPTIGDWPRS